jgi:hypothetical protein
MKFQAVFVSLALVAMAPSPVASAYPVTPMEKPGVPTASFSFLFEDARLYVPVRVDGGAARWFILDTGATPTILDAAFARSLNMSLRGGQWVQGVGRGRSRQREAGPVTLLVGGTVLKVAEPAVVDLAHLLGPTSGRAPAGIIGSQFFREHLVEIDFQRRQVRLFSPNTDRSHDFARSVPLTFADWTPLSAVRMTLPSGRRVEANALIDLGAKSTFLIPEPFIASQGLRAAFPRTVTTGLGAGVGGDTHYAFARARRLELGSGKGLAVDDPVIGLSVDGTLKSTWNQGLLGAEFLSHFRIGFDYARSRLFLTPVDLRPSRFDGSGLFLAAEGSKLEQIVIREVVPGSPGQKAGLAAGDQILSLEGRPTAAMGLPAARSLLKTGGRARIAVGYQRGLQHRRATIQLEDLFGAKAQG